MRITLESTTCGYLLVAEDGRDRFIQSEADVERVAEAFGRRLTPDANAAEHAPSARDFLDDHDGANIEDVGYFD